MNTPRLPLGIGLALVVGVAIGWAMAGGLGLRPLMANGGDRWGDRALASGPIELEMSADKIPAPKDAIYYLNYSTGKLFASIPSMQQTAAGAQVTGEFAERDLLSDFAIRPGMNPHFLMTTAGLGGRLSGFAPLFVIETESGQVATYKVSVQSTPGSSRPNFQLLDRKVDPRLGRALAASASR